MKCPVTLKPFRALLVDDGTLDTVFKCSQCGEVMRYENDLAFELDSDRIQYFKDVFGEDHSSD